MRKSILSIVPLAMLAAPLAMAGAQPGQQRPARQPQQMQHTPSKNAPMPSSSELHKFAAAYEDVEGLRTRYMSKLATAKSTSDRSAIKKRAATNIKAHIRKHMTISDYQKVGKEINNNPKARQKLIKILQADQKKSAPPTQGGGGRGG